MISKVKSHHKSRLAYIYIRQSTLRQVRHHQESTQRQYALREKAIEMGWSEERVCLLDEDLGLSGSQGSERSAFNTLVADVSMGKVGAVFALEASRLSRSFADWQRLVELCALTDTLIVDEDGCYDASDFNDQLLLGLKGTMSQAELHFLRLRLEGGKLSKAQKGELRFPLPVGLCYDEEKNTVLDPDEEVRGAVRLLFQLFRQTQSAYAVTHIFAQKKLSFPKRSYGGAWAGKLIWGRLTNSRVLGVLKNPSYAGTYVYGRYETIKEVSPQGDIHSKVSLLPIDSWKVIIHDHHEGYITWDEFIHNQTALDKNRTNKEEMLLSGSAREGLALLQGLLICGKCGRKIQPRYKGNKGIYPTYDCNWLRREGLSTTSCLNVSCGPLDSAISERILEIIQPDQINIALEAIEKLEERNKAVDKQWEMKIDRAEYQAQLAQKRYQQVDPENRLVAANLEVQWEKALVNLEKIRKEYEENLQQEKVELSSEQKNKLFSLAKDLPKLWQASTTKSKDRKKILRLLIKDITIQKTPGSKQITLQVRWMGGACENLEVALPAKMSDRLRYSEEFIEQIRQLAKDHSDNEIASILNEKGVKSSKGESFNPSKVKWIRYRGKIPSPILKKTGELTVREVTSKFGVTKGVVYYWINRKVLSSVRKAKSNTMYLITIDKEKEKELFQWVENSPRIQKQKRKSTKKRKKANSSTKKN